MKERKHWSLRSFSTSGDESWKESHWREAIQVYKCGKSFPWSIDMKYHQRIHEGNNHWSAPKCDRSFSGVVLKCNAFWNGADRTGVCSGFCPELGEKPSNWSKCGKSFSEWDDLMDYQRICEDRNHWIVLNVTGAFPYQVKIHKMTHTGENSSNCTKCGNSFSGSRDMKYH